MHFKIAMLLLIVGAGTQAKTLTCEEQVHSILKGKQTEASKENLAANVKMFRTMETLAEKIAHIPVKAARPIAIHSGTGFYISYYKAGDRRTVEMIFTNMGLLQAYRTTRDGSSRIECINPKMIP